MIRPVSSRVCAVFAAVVLLSGCVNLKSPPDPTRYYLLNGAADAESIAADPISTGPVIRVAPVALDPYLDTRYMVLRLQEFEVQFSDINRWGEELSENIRRVLATDLHASGRFSKVLTRSTSDADYTLRVHIHRFEGVPPDIAHLSASWRLEDDDGRVIHSTVHEDRNRGWQFENYAHLAQKLDESLLNLSTAIAAKVPR